MKTFTIAYAEALPAILNESSETFERDARMALAVKLFELGRLTSGQAAEMAGVGRAAFLLKCRNYGAASVQWDKDELDAEFKAGK